MEVLGAVRLEEEDARLGRLLADAMLGDAGPKDLPVAKVVTPAAMRGASAHLVERREMGGRRAWRVIGAERSSVRCEASGRRGAAQQAARAGARAAVLWPEAPAPCAKRVLGTRAPMAAPDRPNARWSVDFVHDQMVDGRRFGTFDVVDDRTPLCPAPPAPARASPASWAG